MTRVIIAGSRNFDDYELLCSACDRILGGTNSIEIVSGAAKGADALGEKYAGERGYPLFSFQPTGIKTEGLPLLQETKRWRSTLIC